MKTKLLKKIQNTTDLHHGDCSAVLFSNKEKKSDDVVVSKMVEEPLGNAGALHLPITFGCSRVNTDWESTFHLWLQEKSVSYNFLLSRERNSETMSECCLRHKGRQSGEVDSIS